MVVKISNKNIKQDGSIDTFSKNRRFFRERRIFYYVGN